ncbi:MAG: excinuclease ABC subunit UvrA [Candidatus Magasanikbacteria bacterium]|nr:excinuclease ABC subunit UvrA [Candidatus Magasanikbacteria bacterium]
MSDAIVVKNARVHNLKNVSVTIPKNKLTVITGLSGSGKSSLAFDTIYAEGQRRYAESLNAYARQFMDVQDKPDVDEITGLSPTIAIDQKHIAANPRSTVGTVTEIYDYLRLLFARIGVQYCPDTNEPVRQYTTGEITELVRTKARGNDGIQLFSPFIKSQTLSAKELLKRIEPTGCELIRVNGTMVKLDALKNFPLHDDKKYDVDLFITTINDVKKQSLAAPIEKAIDLSNGFLLAVDPETGDENLYSTIPFCTASGRTFEPIEPRTFSFNSPYGACPRCTGLGYTLDVDTDLVIPNPRLTLAEGAIQPWTRIVGNQSYYQQLLEAVATSHHFSLDTPVKDLPQAIMDILFYGTDGQTYDIGHKKVHFEGIVPNLTTRHAETDSEYIRKEIEQYMREKICPTCDGKRLKPESLSVRLPAIGASKDEYTIADIAGMTIEECIAFFSSINYQTKGNAKKSIESKLSKSDLQIATPLVNEIKKRLEDLLQVGLYYLTLDRSFTTLSGGEAQRIRLSTQLSTGLTDVIYILDEPSIGLHSKDNDKLIDTLKMLRDLGNTVIVVEHDAAMIESADYVIDVGPGAGEYGGEIMANGTPTQIKKNTKSITGHYLSGKESIAPPKKLHAGNGEILSIIGASGFNLKQVDLKLPLGKLVCVTGVSGSGKSTLISHTLGRALSKHFYRAKTEPAPYKSMTGVNHIDKIIAIDQTPIGRTPRSNPATYTGIFTAIRDLFTAVPEAHLRGYDAGMFSFNVKGGGRCEACAGDGAIRIPMQFLADVFVECTECGGKRYNKEALEIHYSGKTIADVLSMTVEEASIFFRGIPAIADKLQIVRDVGLGYLHLGQPATTLSGGEAQRIKLATELSRRATGRTLYILDEPTTGLHFEDIKRLLHVLNQLVDKGNTVLIIEHNLDVIKCADWVIDMGPEGGKRGGEIVAEGTPKDVAKVTKSITGKYLKAMAK